MSLLQRGLVNSVVCLCSQRLIAVDADNQGMHLGQQGREQHATEGPVLPRNKLVVS